MPITLGCPGCGKRFKARDESAGKKVKCPYCQIAVQVPTPDESARAGAPTAPIPASDSAPIPLAPSRPAPPPVVASPDEWGALPTGPAPSPAAPPPPLPNRDHETFPLAPPPAPARGNKDRPKPSKPEREDRADEAEKAAKAKSRKKDDVEEAPEKTGASGWRSVRRGLFWVQFALLWFSLIGFVGFGKTMYTRSGNALPKGDGTDWVSIEGYVNAPGPNSVKLSKGDLTDLALYSIPTFLGGLFMVFGRLIASGAPRSSGARSLFAFSGLLALIGLAAMFGWFAFSRLLMKDEEKYTFVAFVLLLPLAEFWFLTGVTACGLALKRAKTARAVGAVGFVFALTAFVSTFGWDLYVDNYRRKNLDDELKTYEQAALLIGWLILVGLYSRAVRNVRVAAREYLDTVEET
jgi:hypothetical protein